MKNRSIILTAILSAALGLMSALTAQAATTITYLPFNITAPGTYVLARNLTYPTNASNIPPAISVAANIIGTVVIDLKGHTLWGPGGYAFSVTAISVLPTAPIAIGKRFITVQNGTIRAFDIGLLGQSSAHLTINAIVFTGNTEGVRFVKVSYSKISNCTFDALAPDYPSGIEDENSSGGNSYSANKFLFKNTQGSGGYPLIISQTDTEGPIYNETLTNAAFALPGQ